MWLGTDYPVPKVLVLNEGWKPVELPNDALCCGRMHLSREQVAQLWPLLKQWCKTGYLDSEGEQAP